MALQQPEEISQPTPEQSYFSTAQGKFDATDDPTVNDDATLGYAPNSFWYRTDTHQAWQCVDNTGGAAVWNEIGTHSKFLKIGNVIQNSPTVSGLLYVGASNTLQSSPALGALQSIRRNAANTAFEAYTPSTGITIGQAVTSGGANRVLYEDGSQNLAASANLIYDGHLKINTGTSLITLGASDASAGTWIRNDGSNAVISTKLTNLYIGFGGGSGLIQHFYAGTTPSEVLTLSNNRVAIGSGSLLRSEQSAGGEFVHLTNGSDANLAFSVTPAGAGDKYSTFSSTVPVRVTFGANSVEVAAVYPNGSFGIGTGSTQPSDRFHNTGTSYFGDNITIADGKNLVFNTTTGTKIGTGSTQKIGCFGATPVAQRTNLGSFIDNSGGDNTTTTFNDPGASYNQTYWKDFVASVVKFMDATSNHFQDLGLTA